MATERDLYFFDLQGYLILRGALTASEVRELNAVVDAIPPLKPGQWYGAVHGHAFGTRDGVNYQQIYEAGEPFERLIDHPSWIEKIKAFVGGQQTFDAKHGPLFIDEAFVNLRQPGEAIGLHSGGDNCCKRNQYRVLNGKLMVGQVNVLLALKDIGPGDGATMIIPASHKQNFPHPDMAQARTKYGNASGDNVESAIEVHLNAGDALIFTDTLCHGAAQRTNPGQRRICIYRYGPSWGFFRHPYRPSRELLARLTPARRQIVWPHEPVRRTPNLKEGFEELDPSYPDGKTTTGMGG
ncbi:MAG: phytanoyl-CoA dioxygenase family protein [Tepidisphaeraceae bacterium]